MEAKISYAIRDNGTEVYRTPAMDLGKALRFALRELAERRARYQDAYRDRVTMEVVTEYVPDDGTLALLASMVSSTHGAGRQQLYEELNAIVRPAVGDQA